MTLSRIASVISLIVLLQQDQDNHQGEEGVKLSLLLVQFPCIAVIVGLVPVLGQGLNPCSTRDEPRLGRLDGFGKAT